MASYLPADPRLAVNNLGVRYMDSYGNSFGTFQPFPRLPFELRQKVWIHALRGPSGRGRIIRVQPQSSGFDSHVVFRFLAFCEKDQDCCDPIRADIGLRLASKESRARYIHKYKFSLPAAYNGLIRFAKEDIIIFTSITDTSMSDLDPALGLLYKSAEWKSQIRHLGVRYVLRPRNLRFLKSKMTEVISHLSNLKTLTFCDFDDNVPEALLVSMREPFQEYSRGKPNTAKTTKLSKVRKLVTDESSYAYDWLHYGCRVKFAV